MTIHTEIREQVDLAAFYAEDGAFRSAVRVLRAIADKIEQHATATDPVESSDD